MEQKPANIEVDENNFPKISGFVAILEKIIMGDFPCPKPTSPVLCLEK